MPLDAIKPGTVLKGKVHEHHINHGILVDIGGVYTGCAASPDTACTPCRVWYTHLALIPKGVGSLPTCAAPLRVHLRWASSRFATALAHAAGYSRDTYWATATGNFTVCSTTLFTWTLVSSCKVMTRRGQSVLWLSRAGCCRLSSGRMISRTTPTMQPFRPTWWAW